MPHELSKRILMQIFRGKFYEFALNQRVCQTCKELV